MQKQWSEYFVPDFEKGTLTWKERPSAHFKSELSRSKCNNKYSGKLAGYVDPRGYVLIGIDRKLYQAHRILWEMANGPIPHGYEIDHRDENKRNNALLNLRPATRSQNSMNKGKQRNNTSGYKGVSAYKGRWKSQLTANGILHRLGLYNTKWGAYAAYREAAAKYHGDFLKY